MTIPASQIVTIVPGVVSSGDNGLVLNGLFLTENTQMPTGEVFSFVNAAAVAAFFGPASAEAAAAEIYFAGYANATAQPTAMLFAPYNSAARAAWVQSGSLAGMTLTELKAITPGTLTIDLDGTPETSSSINLSGATSFTNAATIIEAAFGTAPVVAWNPVNSTFTFTSNTTGPSSSLTVTTGAFATALSLTAATGAISSLGAAVDTPSSAMSNAVSGSQNWVSMVPLFEPSLSNKELFAIWFNAQNNQYVYLAWDSDVQASVQGATEPFGVVAKAAEYNGVICIGGDPATVPVSSTLATLVENVAIFLAGAIASVNTQQTNGRVTFAFLSQAGLLPTCANAQTAANLLANGYNYYGSYATANQGFVFFYNGQLPGEFDWLDSFIDQVWLNSQFQIALMNLLTRIGSVPYTPAGYSLVRAALLGPIAAAINFGAIRTGVNLSPAQIAEVNNAAGSNVAPTIEALGWYLQIQDPGATAREERATPIINFWFTDGGAVQQITMSSIDIL